MFLRHNTVHHRRWHSFELDAKELFRLQDAADKSDVSSADEHLVNLADRRRTTAAWTELELERAPTGGLGTSSDDEPAVSRHAYIKVLGPDELEPEHEHVSSHFFIEEDELVDTMGVSGLCLLSHSQSLYEKCTVVSVALQAFFMQFVIFYFMSKYIVRAEQPSAWDRAGPVKPRIIMIAIYVHIMNVLRDVPFGLSVLVTFPWLQHGWKNVAFTAPIYMIDTVIVPSITAVLGSLFLCTSKTSAEVVLNSCAVYFVNGIDNALLKLSCDFKELSRFRSRQVVFVPYQPKMVKCLDYSIVVFPIFPMLWAFSMEWIGLDILELYKSGEGV